MLVAEVSDAVEQRRMFNFLGRLDAFLEPTARFVRVLFCLLLKCLAYVGQGRIIDADQRTGSRLLYQYLDYIRIVDKLDQRRDGFFRRDAFLVCARSLAKSAQSHDLKVRHALPKHIECLSCVRSRYLL